PGLHVRDRPRHPQVRARRRDAQRPGRPLAPAAPRRPLACYIGGVDPAAAAELVRKEALTLGFARVGFTPAAPLPGGERHRQWMAQGYAAEMAYLDSSRDDPRALLPEARTVVSLALAYGSEPIPAERLTGGI